MRSVCRLLRGGCPGTDTRVESHVATCARCQGLLRDLDDIRETAASLPDLAPSHDLWGGIEARIQPSIVSIAPRRSVAAIPRSWLATAAAALIVVSSSVTYVATSKSKKHNCSGCCTPVGLEGATVEATGVPESADVAASPDRVAEPAAPRGEVRRPAPARRAPRTVISPAAARATPPAELALTEEIDQLQELLATRQDLEPQTIRVIEENLAIIDGREPARAAAPRPRERFSGKWRVRWQEVAASAVAMIIISEQRNRGKRRNIRLALAASVAMLAVVGTAGAQSARVDTTIAMGANGILSVSVYSGSVNVTAGTGSTVRIRGMADRRADLDVRERNNGVRLQLDHGAHNSPVDLDIGAGWNACVLEVRSGFVHRGVKVIDVGR